MVFDTVLGPDAGQDRVFDSCCGVCEAALAGYNACIMSYGQTGSGKTHTLVGDMLDHSQQQLGIIPRAALQLCQHMGNASDPGQLRCTVSCAEVYCERVRDLLADGDADQDLPITQVCTTRLSLRLALRRFKEAGCVCRTRPRASPSWA